MAKTTYLTRATALEFAIEQCASNPQVVNVLKKMHASITKPRKRSDAPSKARVENLALVDAAIAAMGSNEVSALWLTDHVRGILTVQKAAAVMRLGVEVGKIIKVTDGRKVSYKAA